MSYTQISGSVFERVLNEDGTPYTFPEGWRCTAFEDASHPRIPKTNPNYVFSKDVLQDLLVFLLYPQGTALWLTGPTGCGKTSAVMQVLGRLNWPTIDLTLNNRFEFSELKGQWGLFQEKGQSAASMRYIHNALAIAMSRGYVLILNEADLANPGELSALNDVIEGRNLLIAENKGEVIKPHPMFRLIVTANTAGGGDESGLYLGTQQQNVAAMDRYRMLKVTYPSQNIEKGILKSCAPHIGTKVRNRMVKFAAEMRRAFTEGRDGVYISVPFSTRTLVNWANTVQFYQGHHNALKKALDLFFLNKLSVEEAEAAETVARLVFGECWKVEEPKSSEPSDEDSDDDESEE